MVYLGVFPTALAFTTYAFALRHMTASSLGVTTYLVPPITIVMALVFLGETPPTVAYVGGVLALVGVAIARRSPTRKQAMAVEQEPTPAADSFQMGGFPGSDGDSCPQIRRNRSRLVRAVETSPESTRAHSLGEPCTTARDRRLRDRLAPAGAALVTVAAVAATALVSANLGGGTALPSAKKPAAAATPQGVVTEKNKKSPAETKAYWTAARMKAAPKLMPTRTGIEGDAYGDAGLDFTRSRIAPQTANVRCLTRRPARCSSPSLASGTSCARPAPSTTAS